MNSIGLGPAALAPALALALAGCEPAPFEGTSGTDVEPTACGRGVVTVNTDFQSTNVSLVGLDGQRLSESFFRSSSGDVAAPSMPVTGDDLVLLDRKRSLVTWASVRTSEVRAELHADGDELAQNPQDYLPVAANKAYVTRHDAAPGKGPHGDVIVVEPASASVTAPVGQRIDIAAALQLASGDVAHPTHGVVVAGRAYVAVFIATKEYAYGNSYVVAIDTATDEVVTAHEIEGMHDCTAIALSPSGDELAVACSGDLQANGEENQEHAGVVILSRDDLSEKARFEAPALGAGIPGFSLSFVSEGSLLVSMLGNVSADSEDRAILLDLKSGDVRDLHAAAPIKLNVLCPACADAMTGDALAPPACFVTDAEAGLLLRFPVEGSSLGAPQSIVVDDMIGLPPQYLGQF